MRWIRSMVFLRKYLLGFRALGLLSVGG